MNRKPWLVYALVTTAFWGLWGAFIETPEKAGFPATLSYVVWALTMVPCAVVALRVIRWKLEYNRRSLYLGAVVGFLGAGGQVVLFEALRLGPAYLVFPIISLSPVVTILLSCLFLRERASQRCWAGIILALIGIPLLSYQPPGDSKTTGCLWLILTLLVFLAWGIQSFYMKFANETMKSESIFFYMMLTSVFLIPITLLMTDFSKPINWGFRGPWLAAGIQLLNSIGALCLVYAFRFGKAIIVSPLTNAVAPVITVLISLVLYRVVPHPVVITGMVFAIISIFLIAIEPEKPAQTAVPPKTLPSPQFPDPT